MKSDGPGCGRRQCLVVLTNIPTPYRNNFFRALGATLAQRGIDFRVLFCARTEWNRHWSFDWNSFGFEYQVMPGVHPRLAGVTWHFNPAVGAWLRRLRPTWLLSAGAWLMPTGVMALRASRGRACQRIFWSEGHEDAVLHPDGRVARVRRRVLRSYDAFAVPNGRSARFLARELGATPRTIKLPNTVDDRFYVPPPPGQRLTVRERLGIEAGDLLIVQVAQLEDRKGTVEMAGGWKRASQEHPQLRLALVGTGSLDREIRSRFSDAIGKRQLILPGSLPAPAVRDWLYAADAFALASKRDPNPLSAIEAALCGLPVLLSTRIGNFGELCIEHRTGMPIEEPTAESVAATMKAFAAMDPEERRTMGAEARKSAVSGFSTSDVAASLVSELQALNHSQALP